MLWIKAASTHRSVWKIVNDALRLALREDQDDLAVFDERAAAPIPMYEELQNDLRGRMASYELVFEVSTELSAPSTMKK
jgi:hypothetical protein